MSNMINMKANIIRQDNDVLEERRFAEFAPFVWPQMSFNKILARRRVWEFGMLRGGTMITYGN